MAPPEVRCWVEQDIAASLAQIAVSSRDTAPVHAAALAACVPDEGAVRGSLIPAGRRRANGGWANDGRVCVAASAVERSRGDAPAGPRRFPAVSADILETEAGSVFRIAGAAPSRMP
jgi:hypothetical protein